MATLKQQIVARKLSENIRLSNPKTKQEILKEAGYSDSVSEKPKLVTESKEVKALIEKYMPTDELLDHVTAVYKMNKGDPSSVPAMRLAADIKGLTKNQQDGAGLPLQNLIQININ